MSRELLLRVAATPFRLRDTDKASKAEFVYTLSRECGWFTPSEAEQVAEMALENDLLSMSDGELHPEFELSAVEPIDDIRSDQLLAGAGIDSVLEDVVDRLVEETGYSRKEAVAAINRMHHELGNVDVDAAAVVVAKREGFEVQSLVDRALEKLKE